MEPLKEGEVICSECNGCGTDRTKYGQWSYCKKCRGDGKLDWVEMVVGKRVRKFNPYDSMMITFLSTYYPKLVDKDLVNIQPMITYGLKVKYGTTKRR